MSKGTDVASYDPETGELTPLYNPRTQNWDDHFETHGAEIRGKTPVGRVTAYLLQFNATEQVDTRQFLISAGLW